MNIKQLQQWLNNKIKQEGLKLPLLNEDGLSGPATRNAIYSVFSCKNAKAATEEDILRVAKMLGDTNTRRLKAIAKVESNGSGWDSTGLPKILYERHYFYRHVKRVIFFPGSKDPFLSNKQWGGYTQDFNKNNINDSWEKLAHAVSYNVIGAFASVSASKFQIMTSYYKELGYNNPLDLLFDISRDEAVHYELLAKYILNIAKSKSSFLKLSANPEDNRSFARSYNGPAYASNKYHIKLANSLK